MDYDQDGTPVENMRGLGADGSTPTIGTSAAEFVGAFPDIHFNWSQGFFTTPSSFQQEAAVVGSDPSTGALLSQAAQDAGAAVSAAEDSITQGLQQVGSGAVSIVKFGAIALLAYALLEAVNEAKKHHA